MFWKLLRFTKNSLCFFPCFTKRRSRRSALWSHRSGWPQPSPGWSPQRSARGRGSPPPPKQGRSKDGHGVFSEWTSLNHHYSHSMSFYVILCHSMSWSSQEFDEIPWNSMNSDESLMHSEHQSKDAILLNFLKDSETSLIVLSIPCIFNPSPFGLFLWSVWQRSISCRYEACN